MLRKFKFALLMCLQNQRTNMEQLNCGIPRTTYRALGCTDSTHTTPRICTVPRTTLVLTASLQLEQEADHLQYRHRQVKTMEGDTIIMKDGGKKIGTPTLDANNT